MGDLLVSRFRVPSGRKRPKQRPAREAHAGLAVRYAIRPKESTFLADARYRTGRPPPTPACLHVAWKDLVSVGSTRYVCARVERRTTPRGEVAEWLNAPHSKCGILARVSGVRIPPSPPLPLASSLIRVKRLFRLGNDLPQLPTEGDGRWTFGVMYRPMYRRTYRWTYRRIVPRRGRVRLPEETRGADRRADTSSGQDPFIFSRSGCRKTSADRLRAPCASASAR